MASQNITRNMEEIASGRRINSASDDASGLAQSEALSAQIAGLEQGSRNAADMSNLVTTAEGAAGLINAGLNRAEQLTLQAQNGTLTDSDRAIIQNEVNEIMAGINQISQNTQSNGTNLLNGSANNLNTASSPNGTGQQISIPDLGTESLGLDEFDVTSENSLETVRAARTTVNNARASMGASINRMESTINANSISSLNLANSRSRIVDTDIARASSEAQRDELRQEYALNVQRREMEAQEQQSQSIFL
jgi:flagellin